MNNHHSEESFFDVCARGCLSDVKAYYCLHRSNINIHRGIDKIFRHACIKGNLHIAQWLHSSNKVDADTDFEYIFQEVCYCNRLNVAQWLHSLGKINVRNKDEYVFRLACKNGYLDLAMWLYSVDWINIHIFSEEAFIGACENNHLHVAKWLHSLNEANINSLWLFCANKINIHAKNDYAFKHACKCGHLDLLMWLHSKDKFNDRVHDECLMLIKHNDTQMLQFLLECGADIHVQHNTFLKNCIMWENKLETHDILLEYCGEEDQHFFDEDIIRQLVRNTKNARNV